MDAQTCDWKCSSVSYPNCPSSHYNDPDQNNRNAYIHRVKNGLTFLVKNDRNPGEFFFFIGCVYFIWGVEIRLEWSTSICLSEKSYWAPSCRVHFVHHSQTTLRTSYYCRFEVRHICAVSIYIYIYIYI